MSTAASVGAVDVARRVEGFAGHLGQVAEVRGRPDLRDRFAIELSRLRGLDATLVVAGETKQGKSSLINALLRANGLVPVDADVATNAQIVIRYAPSARVRVHRDGVEAEEVPIETLGSWASVAGNPSNEKAVRLVEVWIDRPFLASGLTVVDTPGVGGLDAGHAEVTLASLSKADALLFVTDAGASLTEPELAFLRRSTERIGTVLFALTKRDVYAGWERILAEDRALLAAHAPRWKDAPFVPLSSRESLASDDFRATNPAFADKLMLRSGYRALETLVHERVVRQARILRQRNVLQLSRTSIDELGKTDELALAAAGGGPELEVAYREASELKADFIRTKRIGTVALADDLTLLGQHLLREFNRELGELRTRYEDDIRSNKLKPEGVAEGLDADLRAILAHLDEMLDTRVAHIATRVAEELGVNLKTENVDLRAPNGFGRGGDLPRPEVDTLTRVATLVPSLFAFMGPAGAASIIGATAGAAVATVLLPVGIVAGLALVPLKLVQDRRARDQQAALRVVQSGMERTRAEIPPLLSETVLRVRRAFDLDLQAGLERRERELGAAVEQHQRLMRADASRRNEARQTGEQRLEELETLRRHAAEIDRLVAEQAG